MPAYTVAKVPDSARWKIESNGRDLGERFNKKANALERARELKRNNGGTVTVQGAADGRFQRRF